MAKELTDILVDKVALVDLPANKKKFLLLKRGGGEEMEFQDKPEVEEPKKEEAIPEKGPKEEPAKEEEKEEVGKQYPKPEEIADKVAKLAAKLADLAKKKPKDLAVQVAKVISDLSKLVGYGYAEEKTEKAGARFSKAVRTRIEEVIQSLQFLIDGKEQGTKEKPDDLNKSLSEQSEKLSSLDGRVKAIEEKSGVKTGLAEKETKKSADPFGQAVRS